MSSNLVVPGPIQFNYSQYEILVSLNQGDQDQRQAAFEYILNVIVYSSVILVLLMVAALLIKLLGVCEGEMARNDAVRRETDRLISKASASLSYGTCDEDDLESGNCSRCSSSEDLYDENICIVCFDEKRNCFFIPCGHCATCHACAKRITEEENKNCPICRRVIRRVRRVLIA
ncbi:E3 ubiquitin-protein ligase APD1 [Nicotiana tabacum]|uniref:Death-associated inhibitor of apoptosis 1 n=1 Tax=Nicotiana tabacum TaxID=4097 RepID=A0A1S3YXX3_TOBAC|nr:E3 ubiquitin-protein ligase APD1-like [Nicotiana tomentosiformis]XP_016456935.1 PREDICTED: death-associated inhibitor of apoptosis 1-like [Nicotiana tabacum]